MLNLKSGTEKIKQSQIQFLVKHWDKLTRDEFRARFGCSPAYLQKLVNEAKKTHDLPDKRYTRE